MERDPPSHGQGRVGGDEDDLPTYEELASQHGPNSRFGRWKTWVEKRAAERYADDTPERREARRLRGWGTHGDTQVPVQELLSPDSPNSPLRPPSTSGLSRTQTILSNSSPPEGDRKLQPSISHITMGQALPPSHLKLHTFGSRFLPHSELPILSFLPLFNDTKLLIGHMNGLSVLDMVPEATSLELDSREPRRRDIWYGEGVYQLALLEHEQPSTTGTPQGVILALVGAEPPEGGSEKDSKEPHKVIRMYNLASLASITRWAAARKDHQPLDISRPVNGQPQPPAQSKKHKHHVSISRGLKSVKTESFDVTFRNIQSSLPLLSVPPPVPPKDPPRSLPSPSSPPASKMPSRRSDSNEAEWEIVGHEDLPLRWATDYVPLASPNSRLANQSVAFFELLRIADGTRITARLAVGTKQNILLYESTKGERAFRFIKEFYTPIPARSAKFVYHCQHDPLTRLHSTTSATLSPVPSSTYPRACSPSHGSRFSDGSSRRASSPMPIRAVGTSSSGGGQLSLFVVFEKKAGVIRMSDSSVGEIELWEEGGHSRRASGHSPISGTSFRRSIGSFESLSLTKDWKGSWALPAEIQLPLTPFIPTSFSQPTAAMTVYLLTRGSQTHIVPSPLPTPLASHAPLKILKWGMHPTSVVPRVCESHAAAEPFLQVTALSEDGVEVQEFPLTFLSRSAGKGKARDDTVVVQAEVGPGGAGFLCMGGHWTESDGRRTSDPRLRRRLSTSSADSDDLLEKHTREQGFYCWTQKGYDDWRVFWLGGDAFDEVPPVSP